MSTPSDKSSTLSLHAGDANQKKILTWALAAATAGAAGAGVWWLTKESYYSYVPIKYQYRPGTFTGWISRILDSHAKRRRSRRPIRVYMDGCFDLMHYGHANALRQAKTLGDQLVVGLVPDREILRCKGPPLMNEEERLEMVESVKWVDEVLTGVPYDLTPEFLDELFHKHKIDYVLHGDDPCLMPDGTDAYAYAKKAGRFMMIKRTEGVSTTDIVGRMLMCSRDNSRFTETTAKLTVEFSKGQSTDSGADSESEDARSESSEPSSPVPTRYHHGEINTHSQNRDTSTSNTSDNKGVVPERSSSSGVTPRKTPGGGDTLRPTTVSRFMPTSRRIVQFSSGKTAPPGARVVYIDGAFDLFHVGHVEILKAARAQGDFLLVGVHTDEEVTERRGPHLPIMGLHERALSVLACRSADEVIIGAPQVITDDLLTTFGISLVVRGSVHESPDRNAAGEDQRYAVPAARGMLRHLESPATMTSATLIARIVENRALFEARQAKKVQSEAAYYTSAKQYVDEV